MVRIGAFFIAVCMLLIAGSAGVVSYLRLGLGGGEAALVAVAVLTLLVIYNFLSARNRDRADVSSQIVKLSRGTADLARQFAEISRQMATFDARAETAVEKARAAVRPLAVEIEELSTLLKQVADQVALHETALHADGGSRRPAVLPPAPALVAAPISVAASAPAPAPAAAAAEPAPPPVAPPAAPAPPAGFAGLDQASAIAEIKSAIEANLVELYLQPIVTLPQRRVRYYEALSRLKREEGDVVAAADFLKFAEIGGLLPKLDNISLLRCVQVVRRLQLKSREVGLFCNLSMATLTDAGFAQMLEFVEANRAIASSLVFEFTQAAVRAMGPIEHESLAALAERGFRFSMDNLTDLRLEPRELTERGFRFIKAPAALLLDRISAAATDIHPADLSDLLGRFGIDLVADRIEAESAVVDLLDYDVRFAQGFLFSPPRPVRAEALQNAAADAVKGPTAPAATAAPRSGLAQLARAGGRRA
jgi:cyclic-di-GMP phosphodiesterase TipF (flagellum assembly factor)